MDEKRASPTVSRGNAKSPAVERPRVNETWWAYLAGFLDGEGCISTMERGSKPNISYGVQITMKQKYPAPLLRLHEVFECGTISPRKRDVWWRLRRADDVVWILTGAMPYLILKKKQAKLAIKLCERPIYRETMRQLHLMLRELKRS